MEQVRIVSAICENCGPKLTFLHADGKRVVPLPVVVGVEGVRARGVRCTGCKGQVHVATEPAPTPQEAQRG